jgi:hypothetical protein
MSYASKSIAFSALAILCGCGGQYYAMPPSPQYFSGESVSIETWDGTWHTATPVPAEQGAAWDAGTEARIPAMAVKTVMRSNVGRSAGIGAGAGALGGIVLGAGMGLSSGSDQCNPQDDQPCYFLLSAREKALILGLVMGTVGAGLGALIGLASGKRDIFEVPWARTYSLNRPDVAIVPIRGGAAGGLSWRF